MILLIWRTVVYVVGIDRAKERTATRTPRDRHAHTHGGKWFGYA
jgi:hypothetical protein